ncbi:MAG: DUF1566 domain-containing protein [Bacteroidota bacterium]|nr:DUF1566 domain-containing protein [Bacteroidota bacterium]
MSYQAVIRNASDNLVTSQTVGIRISILQGSASGTLVYEETQTPSTNTNGLVSIEIGGGTGFDTISWSNGPYFIKTETDPTGGTSYTITGTSQLLSVPYALHAKTAESVTGTITETDPVYSSSVASSITGTDTTNWNNKQDQLTAGAGIDITGNVVSATSSVTTYSVGDFVQGGIVFWVDETGQHGLVCAKIDQDGGSGIRWYAGTYTYTMAKGDGPYAGELNTAIIIANQGNGDGSTYAARICNELQVTEGGKTYGDWYLPSKEELNLMYQNKATIDATAGANGGSDFASAYYWSSTEDNNGGNAWSQTFDYGNQGDYGKHTTYNVRAVRAF